MVSPKEILKGSILFYDGKTRIVKGIGDYIQFEDMKEWIGPGLVQGEPISEVWLDQLGFAARDGEVWSNSKMDVVFTSDNGHISVPYLLREYMFIHELQLLHFTVTGAHLTVPKTKKK